MSKNNSSCVWRNGRGDGASGWTHLDGQNVSAGEWYYGKIVAAEEKTAPLLSKVSVVEKPEGVDHLEVTILAEALQAAGKDEHENPVTKTVWGVDATYSENSVSWR